MATPNPNTVLADTLQLMDALQIAYGPGYSPSKVSITVPNYPFKPNSTGPIINIAQLMGKVQGFPFGNFNGVIDLVVQPAPYPESNNTPTGINPDPNAPMIMPIMFDDGSKCLFPEKKGSANCCQLNLSIDYSLVGSGPFQLPDAAKRQWDIQPTLYFEGPDKSLQVKTIWTPYKAPTPTNSLNNKLVGFRMGLTFQHATSVSQYFNVTVSPAYVQNLINDVYCVALSVDNLWVSTTNPQNVPNNPNAPTPPYNPGQEWQNAPFIDFLDNTSIKLAGAYY